MTTPKIVWGCIEADGTIQSSSGDFTVVQDQTGVYTIVFNPNSFSNVPAVTATVYATDTALAYVMYFTSVEQGQFRGWIRDTAGNMGNKPFYFIAVGNPD